MLQSWVTKAVALLVAASIGGAIVFAASHSMKPAATSGAADVSSKPAEKQWWTCGMHPFVHETQPGLCPICRMKLVPEKNDSADDATGTPQAKRKILYYWDPMLGPSSIAHAPGKSAMGMDLVPVYADEQSAGPTVKIDPSIVQNMGVRTAVATRGPLDVTVRAVGTIEVPEPAIYEVNLKVNGWIQKLYANIEGMHISKGDVLFDLYSPDVQVAEEELIGAEKAMKDLDAAAPPNVRAQSQSMIDSARQKLLLWGIADQDIAAISKADKAPPTVPFRSEAEGDLVEKMIVEGSAVQAGTKLMRLEDHSKLWLNAQVYEDQIPLISLGQMVQAAVESVPGKIFTGPIMFVHPHVDRSTRTVIVRAALENPRQELHPGMYATVNIVTRPVADALLVPREAVIDTGTRQIAFVTESQGHFDPRKVRMGLVGDGDQVQILEGLAPGEVVVTSGQFLLDVESRTTEAIDKLRHPSSEPAASESTAAPTPAPQAMSDEHALAIVHCTMKDADWLQTGELISNPYLGSTMPTCGAVTKKVAMPVEGTPLAAVTTSYLAVATGFDADKLDPDAIGALKQTAEKLTGDQYADLRRSIGVLDAARDLAAARSAFEAVSAEMIRILK